MTARRRVLILALCVSASALLPAGAADAWTPGPTASPNPRSVDPN